MVRGAGEVLSNMVRDAGLVEILSQAAKKMAMATASLFAGGWLGKKVAGEKEEEEEEGAAGALQKQAVKKHRLAAKRQKDQEKLTKKLEDYKADKDKKWKELFEDLHERELRICAIFEPGASLRVQRALALLLSGDIIGCANECEVNTRVVERRSRDMCGRVGD